MALRHLPINIGQLSEFQIHNMILMKLRWKY
jgi:hypothetical protein